jgi:hypothetical protein
MAALRAGCTIPIKHGRLSCQGHKHILPWLLISIRILFCFTGDVFSDHCFVWSSIVKHYQGSLSLFFQENLLNSIFGRKTLTIVKIQMILFIYLSPFCSLRTPLSDCQWSKVTSVCTTSYTLPCLVMPHISFSIYR